MTNLTGIAVAAVAAWVMVVTPATAKADDSDNELAYLSSLSALGVTVYDAPLAVQTGYRICSWRDSLTEVETVRYFFNQALRSEVGTTQAAAAWLIAAETNLCPWHYVPVKGIVT